MSMKMEQAVVLIGVVGKKGAGTLDNGNAWSTDRVELHCAVDFPSSETMAVGQTVVTYNVENYAAHFDKAVALVGQSVVLQLEFVPSKKLGAAGKFTCIGFAGVESAPVQKPPVPAQPAPVNTAALPDGVQVKK